MVPRLPGERDQLTRVLVTGAAGYVGGRLVAELAARGIEVRAVVRKERDWLEVSDQRTLDLSTDPLDGLCEGIGAVVHLAGANEVAASREPDVALASTTVGTRRLAAAAADARVPRFVYLSTMHVYGAALIAGATVTEETVPSPRHVYAVARLASEHLAMACLPTVVFRLTNSVGAPAHHTVDRWSLVTNDLCRQAALDARLELSSDGTGWRDFVALTDVCRIVADAAAGGVPEGTYNLGSGRPMTIRAVAEAVRAAAARVLGAEIPISGPEPSGPPAEPYTIATDKLAALGMRPHAAVEDAIEETLRFCADHRDGLTVG